MVQINKEKILLALFLITGIGSISTKTVLGIIIGSILVIISIANLIRLNSWKKS